MTHNIVAQFSCSLDEKGNFKEYRVVAGSVFNEEYNETLDSATILLSQVSAEDRLSYIKPYDFVRVFDKASAYDSETDTYAFDKIYLVDSFNEKENNIKQHLFGYTIGLMSETKLLEKIQCPNLTITHDIKNGVSTKKSIYQYIKQYMELYVPKIKLCSDGENWSYEPLIKVPPEIENWVETDFYKRFNVACADLPFNSPTLRQLLTSLMQQVGCIPVVKNRTLGFLDFQLDAHDFGNGDYSVNNTVNYINRSLSSDSFVNSLINTSEQVLDSGNEVICETLGFRDSSNLLLKQQENLKLETSFPIYKINKCNLRFPGKYDGYLSSNFGCIMHLVSNTDWPEIYYRDNSISNNIATIKFSIMDTDFDYSNYYGVKLDDNLIYFLGRRNDGSYYVVETRTFNQFEMNLNNTNYEWCSWQYYGYSYYVRTRSFTFNNLSNEVVGFCFSGQFIKSDQTTKTFSFIKFDDANDPNVDFFCFDGSPSSTGPKREPPYSQYGNVPVDESAFAVFYINFAGNRKWDITKLVVESSVRELLDRDFVKMVGSQPGDTSGEMSDPATWTIENLSKYVYGTVGYKIGSKIISGFSDVYQIGSSSVLGWVNLGYTYIENIINVLKDYYDTSETEDLIYHFFEFLKYLPISSGKWYAVTTGSFCVAVSEYLFVDLNFKYYSPIGGFGSDPFFTTCMFDLYYQPLNSFNLAYVKSKEDIDYPIAQYDGNASGLTDFDRLSIHEQEQVDRFGNETLSINQRTTNYSDIQNFENGPLVFRDDTNRSGSINGDDNGVDYIIFKRSFSVGNYCYNASYVGSKDAILKNYFTSIRTKYRAYQYVDYNDSVLRKERDTLFVRISTDYYDGDDKIFFGANTDGNSALSYLDYFIYDINGSQEESENNIPRKISYEIETDRAKISSGLSGYDLETETIKNSVSCYSTNNMLGITYEYMDNVGAGTYIKDITENSNLGGVPQSWQIWNDPYYDKHEVVFINFINFYSQMITNTADVSVIENQMKAIEKSPIVDSSFITPYEPIFYVCDNNNGDSLKRTFYKDYAERINHTVQFIYYAPNNDVLISEDFISGTPMLQRYEHPFNFVIGGNNDNAFYLNNQPHRTIAGENPLAGTNQIEIIKDNDNNVPTKLRVHFNGYKTIKMAYYDSETYLTTDIAVFKNLTNDSLAVVDYFFAINDTKTDYVLSEKNGILYRRYKVKTYTEIESPEVPSEYIVLEYIQNSGTQYLNLGFVPNTNEWWSFILDYTDVSGSGSNYVMGSRVGSQTIYFGVTGANATKAITIANTNLTIANNYRKPNRRYQVAASYYGSNSGTCSLTNVTDDELYTGEQNVNLSGSSANVCLFALNSSNIHSGMRVHSLQVYKGSQLFRDLVPVKRRSDNQLGMYDKVNDIFYINMNYGSSNFIAGQEKEVSDTTCPRKVIPLYDEED